MNARATLMPYGIALGLHVALGLVALFITVTTGLLENVYVIETVVPDDDRMQEEFVKELDTQEVPAETMNINAGSISTNVGGSNSPLVSQRALEVPDVVQDPDFEFNPAVDTTFDTGELQTDLGLENVTGEVGAVVEGYGAALDRLTQELIRMMRTDKLLVVWLFDESGSMKDDQQEIKTRIDRVYKELNVADGFLGNEAGAAGKSAPKSSDAILTAVTSFGGKWHWQFASGMKPTKDVSVLMADIDTIPVDETGAEYMCSSLLASLSKYGGVARQEGRKLVLIVVSDESGDDGDGPLLEQTREQARRFKAPIYFLGREAAFGSYFAHVEWRNPRSGVMHYLPIRRGPETPFPEMLQHNGFGKRIDSQMSGFGPYTQVRLARDTGGIFFQLPHEQADLHDFESYKYEMLDLREYLPDLGSRREYEQSVNSSGFRRAIWDVVGLLNPYQFDNKGKLVPRPEVTVPINGWYRIKNSQGPSGDPDVRKDLQQIKKVLDLMSRAQVRLEEVQGLRDQEESLRWRANYDLMYAQLFAYRVRLFEYGIALAQFQARMPELVRKANERRSDGNSVNRWRVMHGVEEMIMPNEQQQQILDITPELLKSSHQRALTQFAYVRETHPNTPWEKRAGWELDRNFGVRFEAMYVPPPRRTNRPQPPSKPPIKPPLL